MIRLVRLSLETLDALLAEDLDTARSLSGAALTPYFIEHNWLWMIRRRQIDVNPASGYWFARAAVTEDDVVVGHVGFHGPPDERGMVEVAYSVDPAHRRQGLGRAMLSTALDWAAAEPAVRVVRASISPENAASLATLQPFGFTHVGEQWDEEDGLELLYEKTVR